ncbi:hypothetical protein HYV49_03450 [Candidatus Pacearchaeota archaeon]|nr:hypothetical protein [Candidatus Pacearchaeota archaeon]
MNKIMFGIIFLLSCSNIVSSFMYTESGTVLIRHLRGPSLQEMKSVVELAINSGLCNANELEDIIVDVLPVEELYGRSNIFEKAVGQFNTETKTVTIAGLSNFPCRTILHELVHACRSRRGINEPDHDDLTVWTPRKKLLPKYDKQVSGICP